MSRTFFVPMTLATLLLAVVAPAAVAGPITLVAYNLQGNLGTEASESPSATGLGLTGQNLVRGTGLAGDAGANSMNASGWNDLNANDFFSLGFANNTAASVQVDELLVGTRSSNTGPGFVNVTYSLAGGPETVLTTLNQPSGGAFLNTDFDFASAVVVDPGESFVVFFRAANNIAANGGTIGAAGTFRVTNYFLPAPAGDTGSLRLTGSEFVAAAAVPEPASLAIAGMALAAFGASAIRRRTRR